jgi:hypothetical protein
MQPRPLSMIVMIWLNRQIVDWLNGKNAKLKGFGV